MYVAVERSIRGNSLRTERVTQGFDGRAACACQLMGDSHPRQQARRRDFENIDATVDLPLPTPPVRPTLKAEAIKAARATALIDHR